MMRAPTMSKIWSESSLQAMLARAGSHLPEWRSRRLKKFLTQGFPNRQIENWKYTNVNSIAKNEFSFMPSASIGPSALLRSIPGTYRLVFVNGCWVESLSHLPNEVEFNCLSENQQNACLSHLEMREVYQTPFSLLNDTLFSVVYQLRVPAGVHLAQPIHLVHRVESSTSHPTMTHLRHSFLVDENASATIFEEYVGRDGITYFNNIVNQIELKQNAQLKFYKLQHEGQEAFHIANTIVKQDRDSRVETNVFSMGAKLSRDDLNFSLDESGASAKLAGYYHAFQNNLADHHIRVDHRAPHCSSEQNYRGIIDDKASAVFNGKILVHPNAVKTHALQSNKNLLLSETAEINTKPELEIYADDVKCSHGATVGQLDEAALFYLRSRGVKEDEARHLLTVAFANEILELITDKAITDVIRQTVLERLMAPHLMKELMP